MGEVLAKHKDLERVTAREQQDQVRAMLDLKQRVEQASRALEKMASENATLRRQVQAAERHRAEAEGEAQRRVVEAMEGYRQREAKMKAKCKKYQKVKNETMEALKTAQNYQVQQDTYFRKIINDLE